MNTDKNKNIPESSLLNKVRRALTSANLPADSILQFLARAALTAVVCGAPLFKIAYPFGIACVAAAGDTLSAAAALIGTLIGSAVLPDFLAISAAAAILFFGRCAVAWILAPKNPSSDTPIPLPRKGERVRTVLTFDFSGALAIRLALAAAATMISGAVSLSTRQGFTTPALLGVFVSAIVAPLLTAAFSTRTNAKSALWRTAAILLLLYAATRSLHTSPLLPFDAGAILAFTAPLILAYRDAAEGTAPFSSLAPTAGLLLGLAVDPRGAPIYALAALAATLTVKISPTASVVAAYLSAMTLAYFSGSLAGLAVVMPEITFAAAIVIPLFRFSLIPHRRVSAAAEARTLSAAAEVLKMESARAECAISHMEAISGACESLSDVFGALSTRMRRPNVRVLKEICDHATAARCNGCKNHTVCWEREYATTADTVCRITAALHRDGRVSAAVIPSHLAARCHHMPDILGEINEKCAAHTAQATRTDRTDVVGDDLTAFSAILTDAAAGVRARFQKDEALSVKLARTMATHPFSAENISVYGERERCIVARGVNLAETKMKNEEIRQAFEGIVGAPLSVPEYAIDGGAVTMTMESRAAFRPVYGAASRAASEASGLPPSKRAPNGDIAAHFSAPDGRFFSIISDGMGTGGEAAVTSRTAVTFLTRILSAGVSLKNALTMLNNYLRARNMECSAGLDVMELDLYAREIRFVKSGAAPSFIVREGRLFRLSSKTVPIGILRALDAEMIRFTAEAGDTIVMLSDGVLSSLTEAAWLCDLLASEHVLSLSPEEIAQKIVSAAATESRDDITAAVIKLT